MIENQHAVTPTDSREPTRLQLAPRLRYVRVVAQESTTPGLWPWQSPRWAPAFFTFVVGVLVGAMLMAVGAALAWPGVFA